ncbi:hypothetical protein LTR09_007501 [Extremus antarcticus]|uniref:Uncharacterized protein n=1 Tax=Extremus antarcticus TaxID=702011 RepID=A0AAJ0GD12_9PEZI|nr:hypothetical protein LTR09_007501 [Extremus antarcticus]
MLFHLVSPLLLVQSTFAASHVETFSDGSCQDTLHDWNGPNGYPNGECTRLTRQGNYTSFKISTLDPGCAITIYGPGTRDGPCDSNATPGAIVAVEGRCYNTTWAFYSLDQCTKLATTSKAITLETSTASSSLSSTSSTANPVTSFSPPQTPKPTHQASDTNVGAIAGGVIGGVAFGLIVAGIGVFIFMRRRKQNKPPEYPDGGPGSAHGMVNMDAKELPGGAYYHGAQSRPPSVRSAPGTPGGPQELSTEGIPEVPNYPLVELPDRDHARDSGMRGPTSRMKEDL